MYATDKSVRVRPREEKKLERLARKIKSAAELSERVVGTVPETAELFASEYKPSTEWGEDPRGE
jgi:hypothetical protein